MIDLDHVTDEIHKIHDDTSKGCGLTTYLRGVNAPHSTQDRPAHPGIRYNSILRLLPLLMLMLMLVLLPVLAGCGTSGATNTQPSGAATPAAAQTVLAVSTIEPITQPTMATISAPYDRAEDYSWVAGQLKQQGSCWIVAYVSPLSKSRPDQYKNQFALLPSDSWQAASVQDGEWVIVQGHPEPGTAPASGCTAHGYVVSGLHANPNPPTGTSGTPGANVTATITITGNSGTTGGGSILDIQVTQFTVSANFEIRGQFNATNNGSTQVQSLVPTRLVLKRPSGEVVYDATGANVQVSIMDMKPMEGIPPGVTRTYNLTATLGAISKQVAQGDEVAGTLTVNADGQELQVSLPNTKVSSIRIP